MKYEAIKRYTFDFDIDRYLDNAIAQASRNNAIADPPPDRRPEREAQRVRVTAAGRTADRLAREHMTKHGGSYRDAVRAVLDADPALKSAYVHGAES